MHTCIPALGRLQQEDEEFKARLGDTANSKPVWATQDSNSKANLTSFCPFGKDEIPKDSVLYITV